MIVQQPDATFHSTQRPLFVPALANSDASPTDLVTVYCSLSHAQRQQRFLGTAAIADRYSIPQRTVQDWFSQGRIAAVKVGKKHLVDAHSVVAYLQQCTQSQEMI